jgi:hypothetical protein
MGIIEEKKKGTHHRAITIVEGQCAQTEQKKRFRQDLKVFNSRFSDEKFHKSLLSPFPAVLVPIFLIVIEHIPRTATSTFLPPPPRRFKEYSTNYRYIIQSFILGE